MFHLMKSKYAIFSNTKVTKIERSSLLLLLLLFFFFFFFFFGGGGDIQYNQSEYMILE